MPQRFPALLRAFGSVGDPLCPPESTCFFPRLGHGLGQALQRRRNDHAVIKEQASDLRAVIAGQQLLLCFAEPAVFRLDLQHILDSSQ